MEKWVINFNTREAVTFNRFEDGKMVSYAYSIERDPDGFEVSRTEPFAITAVGYDDGTPFTEADYDKIKG